MLLEQPSSPVRIRFCFKAMGSVAEVHLVSRPGGDATRVSNEIVDAVLALEAKYSRYRPDSVLTAINASAGNGPVLIDSETKHLLSYADRCFTESDGLFDITSGVFRRIWDYKRGTVPSRETIDEVRKFVGWNCVELLESSIRLPRVGMELDLGGIVKEYAADRAAAILSYYGVESGFVNLGGDIRIIGSESSTHLWRIGIVHPRDPVRTIASIALLRGALATSGDYERFFEVEGRRYCHIINPKSGFPVSGLQSVTVCADSCIVAGSLSTIAMLLGKKRGIAFLENAGVAYFVVDDHGKTRYRGPFTIEA